MGAEASWIDRALGELQRQRCKVCWRADRFDFYVPDDLWKAVVPARFRGHVVCLACFDDLAKLGGVDYAPHLTTLYFAGDQAVFEFKVVNASPAAGTSTTYSYRRSVSPGTRCTARR